MGGVEAQFVAQVQRLGFLVGVGVGVAGSRGALPLMKSTPATSSLIMPLMAPSLRTRGENCHCLLS
jgi:hypothetical protein